MKRKVSVLLASMFMLVFMLSVGLFSQVNWGSAVNAAPGLGNPVVETNISAELEGLLPTQETLAALYENVSPSVVNIQVVMDAHQQSEAAPMPGLPFGSPFGQQPESQPAMSQGSGFVYDTEGHIITNDHVVSGASKIIVNFSDGRWARADFVASDPQSDLAVIKVNAPKGVELQPLPLASANSLRVGYYVVALGSPFGLEETLTTGIVSALGRSLPTGDGTTGPRYSLPDVIQTDAAINPGNSGGPLLNLNGEVVGVNFAINSPVRANSGVGFTIPVSVVEKVVPALIGEGYYRYSYLGLAGQTVDAMVAEQFNLADDLQGVYVANASQGGPSAQAGLQTGDILIGIEGQAVHSFDDLLSYLFNYTQPGQTVTLHFLRDGKPQTAEVTLSERPGAAEEAAEVPSDTEVSIAEAIKTARAAVTEAGILEGIESASAKQEVHNGQSIWVVTLASADKTATVTVDAQSGEVLELNVQ